MRRTVTVLLLWAVAVTVFGAGIDTRTAALDDRPNLDKPVSLRVRAATIRDVLEKIETDTKVKLRAERDVANDKVTIYVKDKPARDVLRALAHCFNLCWSVTDSGELRLFMDRDSTAAWRQREYEDYVAILGQFEQQLKPTAELVRSGQRYEVSEQELQAAPTNDEKTRLYQRAMATEVSYIGAVVLQYVALNEAQRKDLFEGKDVTISGSSISDEARQKYPNVTSIRFWIERSLAGYLLWYRVTPGNMSSMLTMALFDDNRYDAAIRTASEKLLADPALSREVPKEKPGGEVQMSDPARGEYTVPRPGEGSAATPTTMSDALLQIAEASDIPVVAQYISEYAPPTATATSSGKIAERLGELSLQHKFAIERDGDFLLAKSMLWHRLRSREVPEDLIRRWQRAITGLPAPTFDIAVEMGNLTWEQIRGLINNSPYWFGTEIPQIASCEHALKLYASLNPAQKNALAQGMEVSAASLNPQQRHMFMKAFEFRERPTYDRASDPEWFRNAGVSLHPGDSSFGSPEMYAVANMRRLATESVQVTLPTGDPEKPLSMEEVKTILQEQLKQMQERIPEAAAKLAQRVQSEHPEIPARNIAVYQIQTAFFTLRIGEERQTRPLRYATKLWPQ